MSFTVCYETMTVTKGRTKHPCDNDEHTHYSYDWKRDIRKLDELEEVGPDEEIN